MAATTTTKTTGKKVSYVYVVVATKQSYPTQDAANAAANGTPVIKINKKHYNCGK